MATNPVSVEVFSTKNRICMKAQDEARIREQLQHIAQWRASGLPQAQWAAQQGIELKQLIGWLSFEGRWKSRLSGQPVNKPRFIALPIAPSAIAQPSTTQQPTIRIEYGHEYGHANLVVHWPISHSTQLAHFLGLASHS
jgi:hypothetical protein